MSRAVIGRRRWWEFTDVGTAFGEAFAAQKWRDVVRNRELRLAFLSQRSPLLRSFLGKP